MSVRQGDWQVGLQRPRNGRFIIQLSELTGGCAVGARLGRVLRRQINGPEVVGC